MIRSSKLVRFLIGIVCVSCLPIVLLKSYQFQYLQLALDHHQKLSGAGFIKVLFTALSLQFCAVASVVVSCSTYA